MHTCGHCFNEVHSQRSTGYNSQCISGMIRTLRGQLEVTGGGVAIRNSIAADGLDQLRIEDSQISSLRLLTLLTNSIGSR